MEAFAFLVDPIPEAWLGTVPDGAWRIEDQTAPTTLAVEEISRVVFTKSVPGVMDVTVCRDGLVTLEMADVRRFPKDRQLHENEWKNESKRFNAGVRHRQPHVELFNAYLACLGGSLHRIQADALHLGRIAYRDLIEMGENGHPAVMRSFDTSRKLAARHAAHYFPDKVVGLHERNRRYKLIGQDVLIDSFLNLELLLAHPNPAAIKLAHLYTLAVASHEDGDFSRSLITAWAVLEASIDVVWSELMAGGPVPVTGRRRDKWKSNNFTASIRIEMLYQGGNLSQYEYKLIEEARRSRNDWMHVLGDVDFQVSINTMHVCALLILKIFKVDLRRRYPTWL